MPGPMAAWRSPGSAPNCVPMASTARWAMPATVPRQPDAVSTVGSGDAFLAGFIAYRYQRTDVTECLRWGLACAAANTQRSGAGILDAADVERIFPTTSVIELESPVIA